MSRNAKLGLIAASLVALLALVRLSFTAMSARPADSSGDSDTAGAPLHAETASRATTTSAPARVALSRPQSDTRASAGFGALLVRVVWAKDKTPAVDVNVSVVERSRPDGSAFPLDGVTDAEGSVRFPRVRAGNVWVRLDREGYGKGIVRAGEELQLTIEMPTGVDASGVVVDDQDVPVPGAEIWLLRGFTGTGQVIGRADRAGRFTVRGIAWAQFIGARAPGYAPSRVQQLGAAGAGAQVELRLVLLGRGGQVEGRVLDPLGQPVAAQVWIGWLEPGRGAPNALGLAGARADADGRFVVRGLAPGKNEVYARAQGFALWRGSVEVLADRQGELDVRLTAGATLVGTLRTSEGAPVASGSIEVGSYERRLGCAARSGDDGSFRIEHVMVGEIEVRIQSDQHGRAMQKLVAVEGEELRLDHVFEKQLAVRGRIVDAAGQPLAGWYVRIEDQEPVGTDRDHGGAAAAADGSFTIANMHERAHRLDVHAKGSSMPSFTLENVRPSDGEVLVRVPADCMPTVRIVGMIVEPDGKPCIGATLAPREPRIRSGAIESLKDDQARFELGPYSPGEWSLGINPPNRPPLVLGPKKLVPNETWDLGVVRVPVPGTLEVTIERASGVTSDAAIVLWPLQRGRHQSTQFVTAGDRRSAPFWTGEYELQISGPAVASDRVPFSIRSGETTRLTVRARAGAQVAARVVEAVPDPALRWVTLVVRGGDRVVLERAIQRGKDGFEVTIVLDKGSYALAVTAAGKRAEGAVTVGDGPSAVTLTLK